MLCLFCVLIFIISFPLTLLDYAHAPEKVVECRVSVCRSVVHCQVMSHSLTQIHQFRHGIGIVVWGYAHAHAVCHSIVKAKIACQHVGKLPPLQVGDMLQLGCHAFLWSVNVKHEVIGLATTLSVVIAFLVVEITIAKAISASS